MSFRMKATSDSVIILPRYLRTSFIVREAYHSEIENARAFPHLFIFFTHPSKPSAKKARSELAMGCHSKAASEADAHPRSVSPRRSRATT